MATLTPAMTHEDALQTIAQVRAYREELTSRAAGVIWMVWGMVIVLAGLVALHTTSAHVDGEKEVAIGLWGLAIAAGALVTNAILRMQALESAPGLAAWIPYAGGALALALVIGVDAAFGHLAPMLGMTHRPLGFASFNLLPAAGAMTLSALQRRRISPVLGYAVAFVFLVLYAVGEFGPWVVDEAAAFLWSSLWLALAFLAYLGVGAAAWMRG